MSILATWFKPRDPMVPSFVVDILRFSCICFLFGSSPDLSSVASLLKEFCSKVEDDVLPDPKNRLDPLREPLL